MNQLEKLQVSDKHQPSPKNPAMRAYQFECHVDTSRTITFELPVDAPVGLAQIIVLFPDAPVHQADQASQLAKAQTIFQSFAPKNSPSAAEQLLAERRSAADSE